MPETARERTQMLRKALRDAGYAARVTSSPASHRAMVSTIDQCPLLEEAGIYLSGYLLGLATVTQSDGFLSVSWNR